MKLPKKLYWERVLSERKFFEKPCVYKKILQPLGRSDYHCPQYASICQVRNNPLQEQTNSFFLLCQQGIYNFEETR